MICALISWEAADDAADELYRVLETVSDADLRDRLRSAADALKALANDTDAVVTNYDAEIKIRRLE